MVRNNVANSSGVFTALVAMATAALAQPQDHDHLRLAARRTIQTHYDFKQAVYPQHLNLLKQL